MEEKIVTLKLTTKEYIKLGVLISSELNRLAEKVNSNERNEFNIEEYKVADSLFEKFSDAIIETNKK